MYAISIDFDFHNEEIVQNLYDVLEYIKGEAITVGAFEPGELDSAIWSYINELQEIYEITVVEELNADTVNLINQLWIDAKYEDPVYIEILHTWLIELGYTIDGDELDPHSIGASTETAISAFQSSFMIGTGQMTLQTEIYMEAAYNESISTPPDTTGMYQVNVEVHNELWQGIGGAKVQVLEKLLRGAPVLLEEGLTDDAGKCSIYYDVPLDASEQPKNVFHIIVRLLNEEDEVVHSLTFYKVESSIKVYFTAGDWLYKGKSIFELYKKGLEDFLGEDLAIEEIEESADNQDVTFIQASASVSKDEIMKMVLAHRIAIYLEAYDLLKAEVIYAFLYQNAPQNLPPYLLPYNLNQWSDWVAQIVPELAKGIIFTNPLVQQSVLSKAIDKNILPISSTIVLNDILEQLQDAREAYALNEPLIENKNSLSDLLALTSISSELHSDISGLFAQRLIFDKEFVENVGDFEGVSDGMIYELEQAGNIAKMAKNHSPMMTALYENIVPIPEDPEEMDPEDIYRISDYAKWTKEQWISFITSSEIALPTDIYIEDATEKKAVYADLLYNEAERMFPGIALVAEIGRSTAHELEKVNDIAAFLDTNPSFNLKTSHIDVLQKENPSILSDDAVAELKVLKRIINIAPNSIVGTTLIDKQIYSAGQIYTMGQAILAETLADADISTTVSNQIFNIAASQYASAIALASSYNFNQANPKAIINLTNAIHTNGTPINSLVSGLPDLENLFGSLDYCECQHCKSVYSPAAYFTDLLRFLKSAPTASSNAKTVLLARRPDLDDIGLNCENANKPLPYIDLVCEVLENAIKTPSATTNFAHNTTLSAQQLKAFPEYLRVAAYEYLTTKSPMNNYFNLWLAEAHLFLEHLGIPYYQLMQTWQTDWPENAAIAAAYFGIYTNETKWITTQSSSGGAPGIPSLISIWGEIEEVEAPLDQDEDEEMSVTLFLQRSKLTYNQLLELFQLEFINPNDQLTTIERPVDSCAIDDQKLKSYLSTNDYEKLDKIHRFLRLWRHTDWALWELDLLIRNPLVGNGDIDENCLVNLQKFHQLQQKLNLSVEELIAFYENIDITIRYDALNKPIAPFYSRLFLNPAIDNPNLADFAISAVTASSNINQSHSSTVAAALGANEAVVFNLLTYTSTTGLDTLTGVYRPIKLAKQLGISVESLFKLTGLTGITPFSSLENTIKLIEAKKALDSANISIELLSYLLSDDDSVFEISDDTIKGFLTKQRNAMLNLKADLFNTSEPTKNLLKRHLGKLQVFSNQTALEQAIDLIYVENSWIPVLSLPGEPTIAEIFEGFMFGHFGFVRDTDEAFTKLDPDPSNTTPLQTKIDYVLGELEYYLTRLLVQLEVTQNIGLPEDIMNVLLNLNNHNSIKLLTVLRNNDLITYISSALPTIEYDNYESQYDAYRLLHKMALLIQTWNLSAIELKSYTSLYSNSSLAILRLNTLPFKLDTPPSPTANLFDKLINWWKFIELDRTYTVPNSLTIKHVLVNTTLSNLLDDLAVWTNWDRTLLGEIASSGTLDLVLSDFYLADTYTRLQTCLQQQYILGAQIPLIKKWISRDGTSSMTTLAAILGHQQTIANEIKKAAKDKYTTEEWLNILKPIQDILRVQKRDALVAHLLEYSSEYGTSWENANDLFQYYLIDVEMSTCQMTSRLAQGIASVQLFVQRCIMNLESPTVTVALPDTEEERYNTWNQWKWMQNYRVWEANRKVFLYPENWIEPDLRDDKSPFFKELESDLLQKDITHENVEEAFHRYLQKVDQVAHIDVMGFCNDVGPNQESLKHVLGRTKEIPGKYFWRTFNESYNNWTAWEAVEVDIKGDHALPVVYNGKLHIFWLEIIEKPAKMNKMPATNSSTTPTDSPENIPVLEIQLAWTVKKSEGWTPKTISRRKLIHPWPRPHFSLHLRPRFDSVKRELWLDLFVSTSREFNDKLFYDQYTGNFSRLANHVHDETYRPWHSSSFVFDGNVQSVKLLGLSGNYYLPEKIIEQPQVTDDGPLQISLIGIAVGTATGPSGPFWHIHTNYGSYLYYDNDIVQKVQKIAHLNQKIKETRAAHLLDIVIQDILYVSSAIRIQTNRGTFFSSNLGRLNNLIATGSVLHSISSPVMTSPPVNTDLTDSYIYVNNSFGADGRAIEPLTGYHNNTPAELNLYQGLHFEYNQLVNNIGGGVVYSQSFPFLGTPKIPFKVIVPMIGSPIPFFYQDEKRAFWVQWKINGLKYYPFYHPYTNTFISELNKGGMDGILKRNLQVAPEGYYDNGYQFSNYNPPLIATAVDSANEKDKVDFSLEGAYSSYNWEIFFHVPLLIATQLANNQRFEEAIRWFHYIFNPTNTDVGTTPQRYWITKPFYEFNNVDYHEQSISAILNDVAAYRDEIAAWKNNPFKPHLVARFRPVAYQRNVVMKYINTLIAWGDQLFRRESLESINQATMLYVMAHELLGDRPVELAAVPVTTKTYAELESATIDYFGNANVLVAAEGLITSANTTTPVSTSLPVFTPYHTKYFCIPFNDKLSGYWDLVEDRLFKIRHCMNIDGVVRQLPLFAPPIDPALLVNAVAAGIDLGTVLDNLSVPHSHYRFRTLSSKAIQFCSEVKSLGQSLLSALQAKDSEGMALLQTANAISLLESVTTLKELQIEESKENIKSLEVSKATAVIRKNFYSSREFMNQEENLSLALGKSSVNHDIASTVLSTIASVIAYVPDFVVGASGIAASPVLTASFGGTQISKSLNMAAETVSKVSAILQKESGIISQKGSYTRRQEEWDLQVELATKEIEQIDKQLIAANIRVAIAEKDLDNHKKQIENSKTEEEYLKTKYTNKELYSWMSSQISTIYFQAYQLAYDMAKRAENSFRYELGLPSSAAPYIKFGYWDSLKKGLLSGDKLMLDINKMEAAYLEQNKREFELTKQISFKKFAPNQLLSLITTGSCTIEIPELWFDMDYPGHYMRRIKSVSLSIPCIVGPYTNVNCTLTLEKNAVRTSATVPSGHDYDEGHEGGDYNVDYGAVESIATSHAQNDSGLFELNFNDERYLPFEGAGVISRWTLSLPEIRQFDYQSISDIVMHIRYTARNGGATLATAATNYVKTTLEQFASHPQTVILSLKQEFETAWHRFINPLSGNDHELLFKLTEKHYPYYAKLGADREINKDKILLCLITKDGEQRFYQVELAYGSYTSEKDFTVPSGEQYCMKSFALGGASIPAITPLDKQWILTIKDTGTDEDDNVPSSEVVDIADIENIEDIIMIIQHKTSL